MCHRSFGYIVAIAQGPDGAGETLPHGRGGKSEELADFAAGKRVAVAEGEKLANLRRKFFVPLARRLDYFASKELQKGSPGVDELDGRLFERSSRPVRTQVVDEDVAGDGESERQRSAPALVERLELEQEPLESARDHVLGVLAMPDAASDEPRDWIVQIRVKSAECVAVPAGGAEEELVRRRPENSHRQLYGREMKT